MKKVILSLIYILAIGIFTVGCNSAVGEEKGVEDIALMEAEKIIKEQGYSLESSEGMDILIGDSDVFDFIKDASVEGGYNKKGFETMTEDRRVIAYKLNAKAKEGEKDNVILAIVVDKGKAIGAYLDYYGYTPSIRAVTFQDFIN